MSRSVIAAAVCLVVLAGCGGTTEPSAPPTSEDALTTATAAPPDVVVETTEAPTSEEPESEGPPEMPEEAREKTEAGAEAFVEHYIEAFNHAYAEGDPAYVDSLSGDTCSSCEALRGLISEPSPIEDYLSLDRVKPLLLDDEARVEAELTQAETESSAEQRGTAVFDLVHVDDSWQVAEITVKADA